MRKACPSCRSRCLFCSATASLSLGQWALQYAMHAALWFRKWSTKRMRVRRSVPQAWHMPPCAHRCASSSGSCTRRTWRLWAALDLKRWHRNRRTNSAHRRAEWVPVVVAEALRPPRCPAESSATVSAGNRPYCGACGASTLSCSVLGMPLGPLVRGHTTEPWTCAARSGRRCSRPAS